MAPHYWGLTAQEYYDAADVWPLDPDGELLLMGIVENVQGINNLPDILRQVKGIGAIWAGSGDLSVSMGFKGQSTHPDVEAGVQKILAICQDFGVPCATVATPFGGRTAHGTRVPYYYDGTDQVYGLTRGRQAAGRQD